MISPNTLKWKGGRGVNKTRSITAIKLGGHAALKKIHTHVFHSRPRPFTCVEFLSRSQFPGRSLFHYRIALEELSLVCKHRLLSANQPFNHHCTTAIGGASMGDGGLKLLALCATITWGCEASTGNEP